MEEYNGISVTSRKPVIFSMDEAAMFPSLKHREVARICREEFLKANLKGEVDVDVIGLYLAIHYQDRRNTCDLFNCRNGALLSEILNIRVSTPRGCLGLWRNITVFQ